MRNQFSTQRLARQRRMIVTGLVAGGAILGAACSGGATESKDPPVRVARLNELAGDVAFQKPDSNQGPGERRRSEVEALSSGEVVAAAPSHGRGESVRAPVQPGGRGRMWPLIRDW